MLKTQACATFQSQIFDESEVITILKVVRWHFCQVYVGVLYKKELHSSFIMIPKSCMKEGIVLTTRLANNTS